MDGPVHDGLVLIKQKRGLLLFHLLVSILFSCCGIFLFLDSIFNWGSLINVSKSLIFFRISFALLLILISVPDCWVLICDIFSPKVVFAYHGDGFYLRNGEFFVRWSDVSGAIILRISHKFNKYFKHKIIALKFSNEDLFVRSLSVFGKFMYLVRKKIYNYGVWICFRATEVNPTEVFSLFIKKCPQVCIR